jgi:hypothetical protein
MYDPATNRQTHLQPKPTNPTTTNLILNHSITATMTYKTGYNGSDLLVCSCPGLHSFPNNHLAPFIIYGLNLQYLNSNETTLRVQETNKQ